MTVVLVLNALLTPTIAVITTYIAWQQWQGNRLKLNMDRYDRRLRVYQEVIAMLRTCANRKLDWADVISFGSSTVEADFLFGPEVRQYIDEIISRATEFITAKAEYRDFTQPAPPQYDHNKIVKEMTTQSKWFTSQLVDFIARDKFAEYLNIS